jgi:hypothetical protein
MSFQQDSRRFSLFFLCNYRVADRSRFRGSNSVNTYENEFDSLIVENELYISIGKRQA